MVVGYQIGQQDANSRTWLKIVKTADAQGNTVLTTNNAYVEVATGLNYLGTNGQYLPSREEINAYPGGSIAQFGQHRVIFANNINSSGAIDLQMPQTNGAPGGQEMKSEILGLAYYDTASGQSVLIAQVHDSQGQIVGSNQVVYPDAFQGVQANVKYVYTRAGLEQDIVLLEQPPRPESLGLSSTSCVLQVLTEFTSAPTPVIQTPPGATNGVMTDETLVFGTGSGAMRMIRGRAFLLGTNSPAAVVSKQWVTVSNRTVLVESVPLSAITNSLSKLPAFSRADLKPASGSPLYAVSSKRLLPAPRVIRVEKGEMELAKETPPNHGLVLDYIVVNGSLSSYFFGVINSNPGGGTTFFISGPVYCNNVVLGSGAVIKYPNNTTAFIEAESSLICDTSPYKPVVFTAADDNSIGENTSSDGGVIQPGGYANPALRLDVNATVENVRICYAQEAISVAGGATVTVQDSQIVNCIRGVNLDSGANVNLNNCLLTSAGIGSGYPNGVPLAGGDSGASFYLQYCTIDNANEDSMTGYGDDGSGPGSVFAVNSIFVNASSFGSGSLDGIANGFWNDAPGTFGATTVSDSSNPFVRAGGGYYYLNSSSAFISAATGWDFTVSAQQTTKPPVVENQPITSDVTFPAQATDNGGNLGYHYYKIDYLVSATTVGAKVTFAPGTVVVWQGQGLSFSGTYTLTFDGTVQNRCYF
ncbi:MAG: hypothetical protein KGJ60_05265, partial [Verrucomicrobiota bacterium]|nr:hypothetical protein [Verrucomicrobiota bacterium]